MSRSWYILHTYTGYEGKIERSIKSLLETKEIDPNVVLDVKVPVEEVVEIKDGKKKVRNNKFLPGYIMLEMDLPETDWKSGLSAPSEPSPAWAFGNSGDPPAPAWPSQIPPQTSSQGRTSRYAAVD